MNEEKMTFSTVFVAMGMMFVTCLIVSNMIAGKMWSLSEAVSIPASVILFPVTYILSDVFTEIYGFHKTKFIIWIGFACNILAVVAYIITIDLPYPTHWIDQDAYAIVFGMAPRVLAASFVAYLFGELSNSLIMSRLKIATKGSRLWMRVIVSSLAGEALDSALFILIAFLGVVPTDQILSMIMFQYLFKLGFELVLSPLTCKVIGILKKKEGIDTFDYDIRYTII